jgi:hypothetical protein
MSYLLGACGLVIYFGLVCAIGACIGGPRDAGE